MNTVPADQDLRPHIVRIATGTDQGLVHQLIEKSHQPNILKYTPKDAAQRFGDEAMFNEWLAGGRDLYWLLGTDDDLAGIIWYGAKPLPIPLDLPERPYETFAIRLYDGYSGHGLAVPAMRQTLRLHTQAARAAGKPVAGLWLETDTDNPAALKVYARFGYREVHRSPGRVTMILPATEIEQAIKA